MSDNKRTLELVPKPAVVRQVIEESVDVRSFALGFADGAAMASLPGQFVEVSLPGVGESTFAVSRRNEDGGEFQVSAKRMGHLTKALHRLAPGETVFCRGPYGKPFPVEEWRGRDLVIVGGGIGLAPLRPVIDHVLAHRADYGKLEIVFGARTPGDMLFRTDLAQWTEDKSITLTRTIDTACVDWDGCVGLLPSIVKDRGFKPDNRVAVVCGPPIMIRFTVGAFRDLGWPDTQVYTTLEMKMQCGIGQCGRCNIGGKLVCKDGPVFRLDQIPASAL
jgi:sulfhydrogenase subunit gamma (sulfur reductase)